MWVTARRTAATALHTAARMRALDVPPKCRHSDAESTTSAMPTSTDGTRRARGDAPNTACEMCPSNGVSGG